ncbi:hypothetical protein [Streptomyces sp. NPDC005760]|uniref:hypothetical protein n=1 Tax=Streptomyces sp. NPDC005760 TaxID=3156718 RepID=UPI0033E1DCA3
MTGQAGIQVQVRVRFMPHHDHRIEVYHAATGRYLGPADLADQATGEQFSAYGGCDVPCWCQWMRGSDGLSGWDVVACGALSGGVVTVVGRRLWRSRLSWAGTPRPAPLS